ncbi:MAG: formimidoylglutamase [Chlamydiales bacterium]
MDLDRFIHPADKKLWQGRIDGIEPERYHQIISCEDWRTFKGHQTSIGIIGFACDEGIRRNKGRIGAAQGPLAFRNQLASLPNSVSRLYDFGDIICPDNCLEEAQAALGTALDHLLGQSVFPIVIGGGHEVSWGVFQGIHHHYPNCHVLNLDAHFDLRPMSGQSQSSSGNSFTQIATLQGEDFNYSIIGLQETGNTQSLFDVAEELDVRYLLARHISRADKFLEKILNESPHLYLSIDMDVFDSAHAPGVSAPQPLGLLPQQIIPLLAMAASSGKIRCLDIAELSPPLDHDHHTARLAAVLVAHFLRTYMENSELEPKVESL